MLVRALFLFFCTVALLNTTTAQSPWARNKTGFYAQLGYHTIPTYTDLFGADGADISLIREVSEHTLQLYGEYGISNRTTAILSVPYRFVARGARNPDNNLMFAVEDTGSISGFGNVSLAMRHQFLTGKVALSGTLRLDLPADKSRPFAGLRTGFNAVTILPTLAAGMGFERFYWSAYSGFAFRTNDYSHFVNLGAEGGMKAGPVWLIAFSDVVLPLENGARTLTPYDALTGLSDNDQGWASYGLKVLWEVNRFMGVVVSGAGAGWAQYVPKSPGVGAAVYFKWE